MCLSRRRGGADGTHYTPQVTERSVSCARKREDGEVQRVGRAELGNGKLLAIKGFMKPTFGGARTLRVTHTGKGKATTCRP